LNNGRAIEFESEFKGDRGDQPPRSEFPNSRRLCENEICFTEAVKKRFDSSRIESPGTGSAN